MLVDAVGDSTQAQLALSAQSGQVASSDDCSGIKLRSSDPAHDSATSASQQPAILMQCPAQQAQQAATSDNLLQHPPLQHQNAAPSTNRHLRKRKQLPSEDKQQHVGPTTSTPNTAEHDFTGKSELISLGADLSHRKGIQNRSKASGGLTEPPPKTRIWPASSASGRPPSKLVAFFLYTLPSIAYALCMCVAVWLSVVECRVHSSPSLT